MRTTAVIFVFAVAVLAAAPARAGRYAAPATGTVTDTYAGLVWQQTPDAQARTWSAALAHCEGLTLAGYADWRLPDIKELRSLIDDTAFDAVTFPGTPQGGYWSATSRAGSPDFAWYVQFTAGLVYTDLKLSNLYVRCVR